MNNQHEIIWSIYNHPNQTSGQHTNGPANVFIRENDSSPWYIVTEIKGWYKIAKVVKEIGVSEFQKQYCIQVKD